jgi:hypothetical protein
LVILSDHMVWTKRSSWWHEESSVLSKLFHYLFLRFHSNICYKVELLHILCSVWKTFLLGGWFSFSIWITVICPFCWPICTGLLVTAFQWSMWHHGTETLELRCFFWLTFNHSIKTRIFVVFILVSYGQIVIQKFVRLQLCWPCLF